MPRIFDNIDLPLLPALKDTLKISEHADFCVGYFNLRGWRTIDQLVEPWAGGDGACCRLLVGMQPLPQDELRAMLSLASDEVIDQATVLQLKRRKAEEFREQLAFGAPTNADEAGLRRLSDQIRAKKVVVKLFLRHALHAKLYLAYPNNPINPIVGFLGSSNLTFAGLKKQGELNVDVLDHDACRKLQAWFEDRWADKWCLDISYELADLIDSSWAREQPLPPYYIYLKMAYHLSQEARAGLSEFRVPRDLHDQLFEFQTAAVKIAAHHVNKRGGVLLGDVVGLGKTLMATAMARIFEDDRDWSTLIICPKNLIKMWQGYVERYGLRAKVLSINKVAQELPTIPARFRLVVIDESHNLRNREGRRYRAIQEYILQSDSKCVLLSATPYNKTYLDLSAQLRLFVPEHMDLGIRPERLLAGIGEIKFSQMYQAPIRSLAAFEKSEHVDDWRDLMRLYMVRRTRGFIQQNYAERDEESGRRYLTMASGQPSYFPARVPKTVPFAVDEANGSDPYARLYADSVVDAINGLALPRYGLGNYVAPSPHTAPTTAEARTIEGLSRAGKRLMGFCRTNLFKRLESGGAAFVQSIDRHILRNYVVLHAIEHDLPIPLGTQGAELLEPASYDEDIDATARNFFEDENDSENGGDTTLSSTAAAPMFSEDGYRQRAIAVYDAYSTQYRTRFKWLPPHLFTRALKKRLLSDARALIAVLDACGAWNPGADTKLAALAHLLTDTHHADKVLVFTQFADTTRYLAAQLQSLGIKGVAGVTGQSHDPTELAWRFSPKSNEKTVQPDDELRVLIATDVLSEGQNLQDCAVIVNYDLPWAIVRLIQRAGRVDRIGQQAERILCYSFVPADGVERIIRLRGRVHRRLRENAEVVGADEAFFDDDNDDRPIIDLYNEKAGILDGDADTEVDLSSYAYQIWKNAVDADPTLRKTIPDLPPVVYSTRAYVGTQSEPQGVLLYMRSAEGNDALAWVDKEGNSVTESQLTILRAAECAPNTPPMPRHPSHHELVRQGAEHIVAEEQRVGGQLGRPSGARFRTYERLKVYADSLKGTLFASQELDKAIGEIYRYPLRQSAVDTLNRQLRSGVDDETLAQLVIALRDEDRLCLIHEEEHEQEPQIICSLGLFADM